MGRYDLVPCTNLVLFLADIPQCGVLHGFTRDALEPDTESELSVVRSGGLCVISGVG